MGICCANFLPYFPACFARFPSLSVLLPPCLSPFPPHLSSLLILTSFSVLSCVLPSILVTARHLRQRGGNFKSGYSDQSITSPICLKVKLGEGGVRAKVGQCLHNTNPPVRQRSLRHRQEIGATRFVALGRSLGVRGMVKVESGMVSEQDEMYMLFCASVSSPIICNPTT